MVKVIFHFFTATLAEPAFPDFPGIFILEYLLSDAESEMRIFIFQSQVGRQGIVPIDQHFHFRGHLHGTGEEVHGNVDLSVTVQLVTEKVGQYHIVRAEMGKYPDSRGLVDLNAGVVCLQVAGKAGGKDKSGGHAVEHIRTGAVADYFVSVSFQHRGQKIIGGSLAVCTADYKDIFFYFAGQFFQNRRIDRQSNLSRQGHALFSCKLTGGFDQPRTPYGQKSSDIHDVSFLYL